MAFSPLTIDTAAAAAATDTPAPVYVYGASGRCWKFKDPSKVDAYFNKLRGCYNSKSPILHEWLIKEYGSNIFNRLGYFTQDFAYNKIIVTPCEYEITVTNIDGTTKQLNPSKWKHYSPNSNITLILNQGIPVYRDYDKLFITYMFPICAKFFDEPTSGGEKELTYELISGAIYVNADFMDYWRGDRILHTTPRPAAPPTPAAPAPATAPPTSAALAAQAQTQPQVPVVEESVCYPFLRFRGRRRVQDAPSVETPPKETTAFLPLMIEVD